MSRSKRFLLLLFLLVLTLWAPSGVAVLNAVNAFHDSGNIPVNRSSVITVRWRLELGAGATGGPQLVTVSSLQGRLLAGGTLLGTVDTTLEHTLTAPANVTVTERLRISAKVLQRAAREGRAALRYQRIFDDGAGASRPLAGEVTLHLSGAAGGVFGIDRVSLRFDDAASQRQVRRGAVLHARAEVSFTGTGLLRAVWEVAGSASTMGSPVFRPLRKVQRQLYGSGRLLLASPSLPTTQAGLYQVRLRLLEPIPDAAPLILYQVHERNERERTDTQIVLLSPGDAEALTPGTRFRWQAVAGASAYRLEIHVAPHTVGPGDALTRRTENGRPLTGMLIPSGWSHTTLSPVTRNHLGEGREYLWRVLAIAADGSIIAVSPLRGLRLP